jgi:hypothetical protein
MVSHNRGVREGVDMVYVSLWDLNAELWESREKKGRGRRRRRRRFFVGNLRSFQ